MEINLIAGFIGALTAGSLLLIIKEYIEISQERKELQNKVKQLDQVIKTLEEKINNFSKPPLTNISVKDISSLFNLDDYTN